MAAAEAAEEARQREEEQRQAAIVAAERERMLLEAAHLRPYLPKGVVQSLADLQLMDGAVGGAGRGPMEQQQPAWGPAAVADDRAGWAPHAGYGAVQQQQQPQQWAPPTTSQPRSRRPL